MREGEEQRGDGVSAGLGSILQGRRSELPSGLEQSTKSNCSEWLRPRLSREQSPALETQAQRAESASDNSVLWLGFGSLTPWCWPSGLQGGPSQG